MICRKPFKQISVLKMKLYMIFVILLCIDLLHCASPQKAQPCVSSNCFSDNCRCSTTNPPIPAQEIPQLISLTFDEAVVDNIFTEVWEPILLNRKNPDGNPISATFFVPHEYTDYKRVQDLYLHGFEIGVNSLTKNSLVEYWATASAETLVQEFGGQRTVISHFANIPIDDIIGARAPQLETEGDVLIDAYVASGIQYDSSWTSRSVNLLFPYTLDYLSTQECRSDTICPQNSHPGFWIAPINNIQGNGTNGVLECNSLVGCNYHGTADEIASWLMFKVERIRSTTKAPLTLMVPSSWFRVINNSYEGFVKFLNRLAKLDDVFLVSQKQVIDWMKNPVPLDEFKTQTHERTAKCESINCELQNDKGEVRYMMSCVSCPKVYPWLGNPLGQ